MRAEGIGQENRFAAIGTYGNDFPFIGLKSPNNTNRAVYQLNQPTDNRSITSNLDSGSKQHSGQEIMKIRLADLIRVAIDFQQTVCRGPPRPVRRKQGSRIDVICIDSPVSIFGINLHSVQHIHLQLSPAERARLGIVYVHIGGVPASDEGRPLQPVFTRHPDSFGFKIINSFL